LHEAQLENIMPLFNLVDGYNGV